MHLSRCQLLVPLLHVTALRLCKVVQFPCTSHHHHPSSFVQLCSLTASCSQCFAVSDPSRSILTSIYHHSFASCSRHHGPLHPQLLPLKKSIPSIIFCTIETIKQNHYVKTSYDQDTGPAIFFWWFHLQSMFTQDSNSTVRSDVNSVEKAKPVWLHGLSPIFNPYFLHHFRSQWRRSSAHATSSIPPRPTGP